jgi:hypothetical protein
MLHRKFFADHPKLEASFYKAAHHYPAWWDPKPPQTPTKSRPASSPPHAPERGEPAPNA